MNKSMTVSAPGKLMLFGEHAVVYNYPCIVTTIDQRMKAMAEVLTTREFQLEAEDVTISAYKKSLTQLGKGNIPKAARFVEIALRNIEKKHQLPSGVKITTSSEFSSQLGFGSSSAVTVCVIKAVSNLFGFDFSQKEIFDVAYKTIVDIQKIGSGYDAAAAVYGGTVYFVTGGKIIEHLHIPTLPLIVGYSGIKADTVTLVRHVQEEKEKHPDMIEGIFTNIGQLVEQAKPAILAKQWDVAGKLMNNNQEYLNALGVSTKKLDDMIYAARNAGAYGAKLSGAGGGDCIIAIVPEEKQSAVEQAIIRAGGKTVSVYTNAEGVKVE